MALTFLGLHVVRHLPDLYYTGMAHMDGTMFSLMVALVVASGTLIGVVPAWLASRVDPALLIKVPQ
jgi:putative ABC transport system permease protein